MKNKRTFKDFIRRRAAKPSPPSEAAECLQRAVRNREAMPAGCNRSILFFTSAKCASTFTSKFLRELDANSDLRHVDYNQMIYRAGDDLNLGNAEQFFADCQDILFTTSGDIYGPLRNPIDLRDMDQYRKIFFLRDPRDVLVSAYYSFGFSHGPPRNSLKAEEFHRGRAKIVEEGIDRYSRRAVLEWVLPLYQRYQQIRETSGGLFLSYRDFVDHPTDFAIRLLDYIDLPSEAERERLFAFLVSTKKVAANPPADTSATAELSHQRSGRHDQYLHELQADTIQYLNDTLSDQLDYWGFETAPAP